jgi:hypothetical protein
MFAQDNLYVVRSTYHRGYSDPDSNKCTFFPSIKIKKIDKKYASNDNAYRPVTTFDKIVLVQNLKGGIATYVCPPNIASKIAHGTMNSETFALCWNLL